MRTSVANCFLYVLEKTDSEKEAARAQEIQEKVYRRQQQKKGIRALCSSNIMRYDLSHYLKSPTLYTYNNEKRRIKEKENTHPHPHVRFGLTKDAR